MSKRQSIIRKEFDRERREAKRQRTAYLRNARIAKAVRTGTIPPPGDVAMSGTLELISLESLLDDECRCQSKHTEVAQCTVEVVARVRYACDTRHPLVCAETAAYIRYAHEIDSICDDCDRPTRECWRIVPV
jgi:hypothetical protein